MYARNVNKQWLIDNNEPPVSGNRIVLGVTLPAVSYQPHEFGASQVITAKSEWLNEKVGLFIVIAISKLLHLFSYNQKPGIQIYKKLSIQLPTKNGEIDFDFMEHFIGEMQQDRMQTLRAHFQATGLDNYELSSEEKKVLEEFYKIQWSSFRIGSLFDKVKTKKIPYKADQLAKEATDNHLLPCLTSSFKNQGLNYFVPRDEATVLKNLISIPSNSDVYRAYFQSMEFTVLSDAYAIKWIDSENDLTPNQYLFAVQAINKVTDLPIYSYKNKLGGWNVVREKYIQLPIKNNQLDLVTMDLLISAIKKQTIKDSVVYCEGKLSY
ncbi:MAG: hypothetical protein ACN6O7_09065 [Sphingobacterium sp.]